MPRFNPRSTALALALAAAFSQAQAQDQPIANGPEAAKKEATQLEAVIVTGSRRVENLKDVPLSISALKGEAIENLSVGGQDIRALSARVPSLNIESDFGRSFPRFYIRGLGNTDFDLNASQPVGLVFDDVVQESPMLKGFPVFDVDQVELLRGPQGTLFGRNSPAGVMKFDSVKPSQRLEGYGSLGLGRHSALNAEAAINMPMGDWAVRASGMVQRADDRIDNPRPTGERSLEGYHDKAARVQAAYKSGGVYGLFKVQGRDYQGNATTFRANIIKQGTPDLVDGFDPSQYPSDGLNVQTLKSYGGSARLRLEMDGITLHSITAYDRAKFYSRADVDGGYGAAFLPNAKLPNGSSNPAVMGPNYPGQDASIPFPAETADGLPYLRQITQEFRVESNTKEALQWMLGAYYFKESLQVDSFNFDSFGPNNPQDGYAVQTQEAKAYAFFGSLNYAVTPEFKVRGGIRYTNDKKDFVASRPWTPFGGAPLGALKANPSASNVSWDIGTNYNLDPSTTFFTRVATGYRAPSIQGRVLFADTLSVAKSEKVLSVEGGIKADLLDNRARISATVFSYRVKDLQLTAGSGSVNQNRLVNADKAVGRGFELDAQAIIDANWRTTLGLSYNDTEIKDKNLFVSACGAPCTVLDPVKPGEPAGSKVVLIGGNPLPRAPKVVWNWTLKYATELAGGELFALTDWAYKDKYNMFLYEAKEYRAKALLEGGLRVGYGWGNYELSTYVRNIANRQQVVAAIDFNNLTGIINEPRSYGVQFRASF
jgi:iron complex outermembrane recepter protein